MQALGAEFSMLMAARGATISESSARASLYMTTLSGAVVALAVVAQAARFGETFFVFALACALGALVLATAFPTHQWRTWMHVVKALPMSA